MEKRLFSVVVCVVMFGLLNACATRPTAPPAAAPSAEAEALFGRAEQFYAAGDHAAAMDAYQEYLSRFADQPMADAALMKLARIHLLRGEFEAARRAYARVAAEYPHGTFAEEARVEDLAVLYQQGQYRQLISEAAAVLQGLRSAPHIFRAYVLVGDAYRALGAPADALEFYAQARHHGDVEELDALDEKLAAAVAEIPPDGLGPLLQRPDLRGALAPALYRLGAGLAEQADYRRALEVLEQLNTAIPDHPQRQAADRLIEEIRRRALFDRHTVGCLLPLSGPYQGFGNRALRGIEAALDALRGQSAERRLHIIIKDTGSDPDQTVQALRELKAANVAAVIGPLVHVEVAAREAQALGIPIVAITQKDGVTAIGDNVFRNFLTPRMQVRSLASFAVEELGLTRFAILYPDETYGRTFMDLFWTELLQYGAQVVGAEDYDPAQTDFSDPIRRLVGLYYPVPEDLRAGRAKIARTDARRQRDRGGEPAAGQETEELAPVVDFQALFIPDSPKAAGLLIPQLAFHDVREVVLLGTNLWHSPALLEMAGDYVQGAIVPDGFVAERNDPLVADFVDRFQQAYQEPPGFIEAILYDTAMILFEVLQRPQVQLRDDIRTELADPQGFAGVTGHTRFDAGGEVIKKCFLLRVEGQRFVEVGQR